MNSTYRIIAEKAGEKTSAWSVLTFFLREMKRFDLALYLCVFLLPLPELLSGYLSVRLPSDLVRLLESRLSLTDTFLPLMLEGLGLMLCTVVSNTGLEYMKIMRFFLPGYLTDRFIRQAQRMDSAQVDAPENREMMSNAWASADNGRGFFEGTMMVSVLGTILSCLVFGFLIGRRSLMVLLIVTLSVVVNLYLLQVARRMHKKYYGKISQYAKGEAYITHTAMDLAAGKDIRIFGMLDFLLRKYDEYLAEIDGNYRKIHTWYFLRNLSGAFFGLLGMELDGVLHLTRCASLIAAALIIVGPALWRSGASASGFLGSLPCTALFLLIILGACFLNTKGKLRAEHAKCTLYDQELTPLNLERHAWLNLFATGDSQKDIRVNGLGGAVNAALDRLSGDYARGRRRYVAKDVRQNVRFGVVYQLCTVGTYLFAGLYGYLGVLSLGSVISFAECVRRVAQCMFDLGDVLGEIENTGLYAAKYLKFMNLPRHRVGTLPVEKRQDDRFSVSFRHVSFRYPGTEQYVLRDLNVDFEIGEKMAIVGRNGSGKSTLIKLLTRLYDVTEGEILVNGIDIRKYDYEEYNALFSVVFQDFQLPDFRLGEIISCEDRAEKDRAMDALSLAGLKEQFDAMPEGLDTVIGSGFYGGGENLSGGERQKLAMARAIYKNAPIVILDEPTARLDPEAECEVFEGFDRMVGRKTAIYISHRLASCRFCEDILVFDQGRLVQRGSHEQLSSQEGLYRQMWQVQARYYA